MSEDSEAMPEFLQMNAPYQQKNIGIALRIPHTRNWMQDIRTPSTNGEK